MDQSLDWSSSLAKSVGFGVSKRPGRKKSKLESAFQILALGMQRQADLFKDSSLGPT